MFKSKTFLEAVMASPHMSLLGWFAPKAEKSIFKNFVDLRDRPKDTNELIADVAQNLPEGERVTLILTKDEFGKLTIPLDIQGAEVIS
jgi:hypothetical protein